MTSNLLAALKSNQARNNIVSISPLIEAAKNGSVESCARSLDEPKVKVDQRDPEGQTALMHAAMCGYTEVVTYLLSRGARLNAKDDVGENALMKAAKDGQIHVVQYLLHNHSGEKKKPLKQVTNR